MEAHIGVSRGYEIKTDNDRMLSIGRYVVNAAVSSFTVFNKYDVAFGCIGIPKCVIPTEILSNILVGSKYIK